MRNRIGANAGATAKDVFTLAVAGTVSAGKTTVLNALLGRQLLYSSNEPATATHTVLRHRPHASRVVCGGYSRNGALVDFRRGMNAATYRQWNARAQVARIHVSGDLGYVAGARGKLDLHDLPGANNSLDSEHWHLATSRLSSVPWHLLCFVLDATAPGTTDEHALLQRVRAIAAARPQSRLLFVLNKVDEVDPDREEPLETMVRHAVERLSQLGFHEPWVVPTMAQVALVARMQMAGGAISARQAMHYQAMVPLLPASAQVLVATANVPARVRGRLLQQVHAPHWSAFLDNPPLRQLPRSLLAASVVASGISGVEDIIHHCLAFS